MVRAREEVLRQVPGCHDPISRANSVQDLDLDDPTGACTPSTPSQEDVWADILDCLVPAAVEDSQPGPCVVCGRHPGDGTAFDGTGFRRCRRCKSQDYCSETCQRKHWVTGHRATCSEPPVIRPAQAPSGVNKPCGPAEALGRVEDTEIVAAHSAWELFLVELSAEHLTSSRPFADNDAGFQAPHVASSTDFVNQELSASQPSCLLSYGFPHARPEAGRGTGTTRMVAKRGEAENSERMLKAQRELDRQRIEDKKARKDLHDQVIRTQYDVHTLRNDLDPSITAFNATGLALVFKRPVLYIVMVLIWALWMLKSYHSCQWQTYDIRCRPAEEWMKDNMLTFDSIKPLASMLTFNLCIFYFGSCFRKCQDTFCSVQGIVTAIEKLSFALEVYFSQKATKWNVIRYVLAAHEYFYWHLKHQLVSFGSKEYTIDNTPDFDEFCETLLEKAFGLLIQVEIQTFRQLQPELRIKFLLSWCLVAFGRIISTLPPNGEKGNPKLQCMSYDEFGNEVKNRKDNFEENAMAEDIRESVMRFKQEIMQVHSIFLFPFSFVNYHFVHMLLVCYVCLVAYVFVLNIEPSVMGIPIYFFTVLPFLVTTEIANGLSSPFGKDLMSFNIEGLQEAIFQELHTCCFAPRPDFYDKIGSPEWCPEIIHDNISHTVRSGATLLPLLQPRGMQIKRTEEGEVGGLQTRKDIRNAIARYERDAEPRRQEQRAEELLAREKARPQGLLAPFKNEQHRWKDNEEICFNILDALRGQWGKEGGNRGMSRGVKERTSVHTPDSDVPVDLLGDELDAYFEEMAANEGAGMDDDDGASVATTESVKRLSDAIQDLDFYMQAEVQELHSISKRCNALVQMRWTVSRRIDLFEELIVQEIGKVVARLVADEGGIANEIYDGGGAVSGQAAAELIRRAPMERVSLLEKMVLDGDHLPLQTRENVELMVEMQQLAWASELPLARAAIGGQKR